MRLLLAALFVCALPAQDIDYNKRVFNGPALNAAKYQFTLNQSFLTSGSLSTTGVKLLGLRQCPLGVAGSDANHYLYISGGSGTAEVVLITGGTCVYNGAAGTIQFTTANTHTGAWTITSATAGMQEAHNMMSNGQRMVIDPGINNVYAPVRVTKAIEFTGNDAYGVVGAVISPQTPGQTVFHVYSVSSANFNHFYVKYPTLQTSGRVFDLEGTFSTDISYVGTENDWDSVYMTNSSGDFIDHCRFGYFGHNAITSYTAVPDSGGPVITNNNFGGPTSSNAAVVHLSGGGLIMTGNGIHSNSLYGYYGTPVLSSQVVISGNIFDGQIGYGIYVNSPSSFPGWTITGNFISNFITSAYAGIYIDNNNAVGGTITGNFISPYPTTGSPTTIAGIICNGKEWMISGNTIWHSYTGVQSNAGNGVTVGTNHLFDVTLAWLGGGSNLRLSFPAVMAYSTMTATAVLDGSAVFCTDCNSTCTAGASTGRTCFRENGAWTH